VAKVFGIREIELAAGVSEEDFERFALQEYLPAATTLGMKAHQVSIPAMRPYAPSPSSCRYVRAEAGEAL
jgi:hypothetical protein